MDSAAFITRLLVEGRVEDVRKANPNIPEDAWSRLVQEQPEGSNNKYLAWMAKQVTSLTGADDGRTGGHEALDLVLTASRLVREFMALNSTKDLYAFRSLDALQFFLNETGKTVSKRAKIRDELPVVFQNDRWKVFKPTSHEAMQKIGGGTSWCVATSNSGHWDNYYSNGGFLVFKAKEELKDGQIYDENSPVDDDSDDKPDVEQGDRFAWYQRLGHHDAEVYNEDDRNIGERSFMELYGPDEDSELGEYLNEFRDEVEADYEEKRESAENKARDEYMENLDDGLFDFAQAFVETFYLNPQYAKYSDQARNHRWKYLNIERGDFKIRYEALTPEQQGTLRDATWRSIDTEDDYYGKPKACISHDGDRFQEYIEYEMGGKQAELRTICTFLAGFTPLDNITNPEEAERLRDKYPDIDDIIMHASQQISAKADAMKDHPRLWPDVEPSDGGEVNTRSIRRQLQADGYDDIAAALESIDPVVDIQSDQLVEIILEGLDPI